VAAIFVGVCVVFIAVILTLSAVRADRALRDAIELFAGAIPLLVTAFLLSLWRRTMILALVFFAGGALATIGGIARALAYVDMTASPIFLISLVACFFVVFVVDTLTRFTYREADHRRTEADHAQSPDPGIWFDETDPYHPVEVPQASDA
jgi:hypothetical protein